MLRSHLEAGEAVLWQGQPEEPSTSNRLGLLLSAVGVIAGLALISGVAATLFPVIATSTGTTLVPGLVVTAAGAFFLWVNWEERDQNWRFAITDRRLMLARGRKLFRTALPGETLRLRILGNIVYWHREDSSNTSSKTKNGRYIGFHGMPDPEAMKATIEEWQEGFSKRAAETAAAFTEATKSTGPAALAITRVLHAETGLHIDVPAGWQAMVSNDFDGPLRLFGLTILPRIIRTGEERAYGDGKPWTTLKVRGAPDAGLYMVVRSTPLAQTLDKVVTDPWNQRLGLEILRTTADLKVGPFEGFSIVRKMPGGAVLSGFGRVNNPVTTRMIWLGEGNTSVELTGMARLDLEDVQDAIDAMVNSLSYQ
jgi:hypothetical protein